MHARPHAQVLLGRKCFLDSDDLRDLRLLQQARPRPSTAPHPLPRLSLTRGLSESKITRPAHPPRRGGTLPTRAAAVA